MDGFTEVNIVCIAEGGRPADRSATSADVTKAPKATEVFAISAKP